MAFITLANVAEAQERAFAAMDSAQIRADSRNPRKVAQSMEQTLSTLDLAMDRARARMLLDPKLGLTDLAQETIEGEIGTDFWERISR